MARKVPKWVLGCGIGCGAIIVPGVVLLVVGGIYIGNLTKGLEDSVQAGESLEERFGAEGSFTPSPDGSIHADRRSAASGKPACIRLFLTACRARPLDQGFLLTPPGQQE